MLMSNKSCMLRQIIIVYQESDYGGYSLMKISPELLKSDSLDQLEYYLRDHRLHSTHP